VSRQKNSLLLLSCAILQHHPVTIRSLLTLLPQGDTAARNRLLAQIFEVFDQRIRPRGGGAVRPSDVVQETMLAVMSAIDRFQGQTAAELWAWIATIHYHKFIDMQKSEGKFGQLPIPPLPDGRVQGPEDLLLYIETTEILQETFLRLSDDDQKLLLLYNPDGLFDFDSSTKLSHREAAAKLGIPELTCQKRYSRARNTWKEDFLKTRG
jgi:RNA polymerase sigma factor (sigma-70 family)